jgi:hypothetical protein
MDKLLTFSPNMWQNKLCKHTESEDSFIPLMIIDGGEILHFEMKKCCKKYKKKGKHCKNCPRE